MSRSLLFGMLLVVLYIEGCQYQSEVNSKVLADQTYSGTYRIRFNENGAEVATHQGRIKIVFAKSTYSYTAAMFDSSGTELRLVADSGLFHIDHDTVDLRDITPPSFDHQLVPGLHLNCRFTMSQQDSFLVFVSQKNDGLWKLASWEIVLKKQ
jgi:hypothetical protein